MKLRPTIWASLVLLVPTLATCGSSQSPSPVTVTLPAPTQDTTPQGATTSAPARTTPTTTTKTTTAPTQTRTAPAPAFTRTTGGTPAAGGLGDAVAKVRSLGFSPVATATYAPDQTLHVLVAARTGGADGRPQQAFFFNGARYLGTDAKATSGAIAVTGHGDTDVTLRYGIYRTADPDCCPSGSQTVHFALDRGRLVALDPIPSTAARR